MSNPFDQFDAAPVQGPDVEGMVRAEAQNQGVDPDLAVRVARQESGLNQGARSPRGAVGVMQLMPGTASDLGVDPTDVGQNIHGGVSYLKKQLDTFGGDPSLAAAAYNAGPGAVRAHGGVPPYQETQNYVAAVAPGGQSANPFDQFDGGDAPATDDAAQEHPTKGITVEVGGPDPTGPGWVHQPNGLPQNAPKPNVAQDALQSAGSGLNKSVSTMADDATGLGALGPMGIARELGNRAIDVGGAALDALGVKHGQIQIPQLPSFSQTANEDAHAPQTTQGRYAEMAGEMLPNALSPGGIVRRAASVLLPAAGATAAQDFARDHGGGEISQEIAKFGGALAGGLGSGLSIKIPQKIPRISVDDLRNQADALYTDLRNRGVAFKPNAVASLNTGLSDLIDSEGRNLYKPHADWVDQIKETLRTNPTVEALDKVRSKAQQALTTPTATTTPDQLRVGKSIIDEIDQFLGATARHPVAMTTASPADAARVQQSLLQARDLWRRMRNVETVSNLAESAGIQNGTSNMGGNLPNMTGRKLRTFIDPSTNKSLAGLSKAERAQLRTTVLGSPLQRNVLKTLGALSPKKGIGLVANGMAGAVLGPHAPMVMAPIGYAAHEANVALQRANLDKLIRMIASGQAPGKAGLTYSAGPLDPFNIGTALALSQPIPAPAPAQR